MTEMNQMAWLLNRTNGHDKRRFNDAIIRCAQAAIPALIARTPANQNIDAKQISADALAIASTIVAGFVDEKLI